jgi:hypothetical protein
LQEETSKSQFDQILDMLNSPGIADNLKELLGSLSCDSNTDDSSESGLSDTISSIASFLNSDSSNQNMNFLNSLKPYLNKKRQKKIEQCEKFVSMAKTFQIINQLNNKNDSQND